LKTSTVVPVSLGSRSYQIHIRTGLLSEAARLISDTVSSQHIVLITDDIVEGHYLDSTLESLRPMIPRVDALVVPHGEASKCIKQCDKLWQEMVNLGTDRRSAVVALGGGVVGDLAGYVAASYARGIQFVQIPTTLLAQVDSSVGGKVGVNLPQVKNMVGHFWQPRVVLIDPNVLGTLDQRNYAAGMAEVIKYGVIMDPELFHFLENSIGRIHQRDPETLTRIIAWCCRNKAEVVEDDETEATGRRAILNYGHTFGHAIEAVFGYGEYLHGEAIAIGMTCAARLAEGMGLCDETLLPRQSDLFRELGLPVSAPKDQIDSIVAAMKHDKKNTAGNLSFILPTNLGNVELVVAPEEQLIRASF
jgi:3-dehydroquinate synthase